MLTVGQDGVIRCNRRVRGVQGGGRELASGACSQALKARATGLAMSSKNREAHITTHTEGE